MPDLPDTVQDKASWVDAKELDEYGEGLTQWEKDFLESLLQQMRAGRHLTAPQRVRLAEIREERL